MPYDVQAVRSQFPALSLTHDARPRVYFDNPAGTQVPQSVIDRMTATMIERNANMGGKFRTSVEATALVHDAHVAMADFYHAASPDEIVFGANMTTLTFQMMRVLAPRFAEGDELITTSMEHDGNSTPWLRMARERGMVVKTLEFDPATYEFDLAQLDELVTERTRFAAVNYSSNILGTINDVREISRRVHAAGGLVYVDAVQYAPHGPIDVQDLGCDFLVSSAYKFYGPHQGVLWGREQLLAGLDAYKLRVVPDRTPDKFETGTQSLEGQAGVLGALEYIESIGAGAGSESGSGAGGDGLRDRTRALHHGLRVMADYEQGLSSRLIEGLQRLDGVVVRGITDPAAASRRVPTVSITKAGIDPADLATFLAEQGVYVWDGHSYALPVIEHLGLQDEGGVVRLGPTHYNTADEVDTVLGLIEDYVTQAPTH